MSNTAYRIIPTIIAGKPGWEIQKKHWLWGWLFDCFVRDAKEGAEFITHLNQEPKYYGGKRI